MLIPGHADPHDRLIVALDLPSGDDARALVARLEGVVSFFKVGYQLFLAEGMSFVRELVGDGRKVFLDLKIDDVEETVTQGVREIVKSGVQLLTIHGSDATARAAAAGRGESVLPKILQVTLLSSLDEQDLRDLGILGKRGRKFSSLEEYVIWRAEQSIDAGCDGVIASGPTVSQLRNKLGDHPLIVTPGIRPGGSEADGHKRVATPRNAMKAGADYLVVGRPIRNAPDPVGAARVIIDEIGQGLAATVS